MKLLMIFAHRFAWEPGDKTLENVPDCKAGSFEKETLVGLIHAEEADESDPGGIETKLIKNLKWGARKNRTKTIVLHSFSHLAGTKASADFVRELLDRAETRLVISGYRTVQTPFGYFLDLEITAPGRSTARIFTEF